MVLQSEECLVSCVSWSKESPVLASRICVCYGKWVLRLLDEDVSSTRRQHPYLAGEFDTKPRALTGRRKRAKEARKSFISVRHSRGTE